MRKLILLALLTIPALSAICQTDKRQADILTINGVKGVFFSMDQAREDARIIEQGFKYYELYLNAVEKINRFENILEADRLEISALNDRLNLCGLTVSKQEERTANEAKTAEIWKTEASKQRKQKRLVIIGASVIVGVLILTR